MDDKIDNGYLFWIKSQGALAFLGVMKMVKGLESQDIFEVKMSSGKDKAEGEEDFEDEEITIKNDEEIANEVEEDSREEQ